MFPLLVEIYEQRYILYYLILADNNCGLSNDVGITTT